MKKLLLLAGAVVATASIAQQPARTVQQDFEAASALDEGTDREAAVRAWQALAARTATLGNKRSHAIVLVRESAALVKAGHKEAAVSAAHAGLADLPPGDATLNGDRLQAYLNLGSIAEQSLDYAGAVDAYAQAESLAEAPVEKIGALLGLLRTETFTDPTAAVAAAGRADALFAAIKVDDTVRGELAMRKAVLSLNRGDVAGGSVLAQEAVKDLGGLTDRIDLRDVSARSTAAIAALLAGKRDDARRYMAMTGAGQMTNGMIGRGVQMRVPDCGGEAGLKPADFAVVEFTIADDGSVAEATPIYAVGGGEVALAFARAARDWSWTPDQLKDIKPFYRQHARVEMRCSVGFERPSVGRMLRADTAAWLADKGVILPEAREGADAAALPGQRAALAAAEAKDPGGLATFAALYQLSGNAVVGREETHALASRAYAIATRTGAPPVPLLAVEMTQIGTADPDGRDSSSFRKEMIALMAKPVYANDPQARGAARLLLADAVKGKDDRLVLLRQVADDAGLARNDPLKVGALVRIASIEQQQDNDDKARAAFERSGLAANQCAIIDAAPRLVRAGGTYPQEARQWGFEGWVTTQFDIAADGKVLNERAILSYPPFVFDKAGTETVAGARYSKTYRPDGGIGCGARTQAVVFRYEG